MQGEEWGYFLAFNNPTNKYFSFLFSGIRDPLFVVGHLGVDSVETLAGAAQAPAHHTHQHHLTSLK